jgi:hypothetical protein
VRLAGPLADQPAISTPYLWRSPTDPPNLTSWCVKKGDWLVVSARRAEIFTPPTPHRIHTSVPKEGSGHDLRAALTPYPWRPVRGEVQT